MEKCPSCGYKGYSRWPLVLMQVAFGILYLFSKYEVLRKHAWIADLTLGLYVVGITAFGVVRNGQAYDLKSSDGSKSTI